MPNLLGPNSSLGGKPAMMVAMFGRSVGVGVMVGVSVGVGKGVTFGSVGVVLGVRVGPNCRNTSVSLSTAAPGVQVAGTFPVGVAEGTLANSTRVGRAASPAIPWQADKMMMIIRHKRQNQTFGLAILCNPITVTSITTAVISVNHLTVPSNIKERLQKPGFSVAENA